MPFFSPGQRFIGARISTFVVNFVPIASGTVMLPFAGFNVTAFDTGNFASLPNGIIIPDGVKLVQVSGNVFFEPSAIGTLRGGLISLSVNGDSDSNSLGPPVTTAGQYTKMALGAVIINVNGIGQTISMKVVQNSGGALNCGCNLTAQFFY